MKLNSKIIQGIFVAETLASIVKNSYVVKYNNQLKKEAIEKRKLCYKIKFDKNGNMIAFYKKTLSDGQIYEWDEIINYDPFNLYRIIKE